MEKSVELENFLVRLSVRLGKTFTKEQEEFFSDFTSPVLSFSLPGTGKTTSAIAGLLTTELFYRIPGEKITAMSFTNIATNELKYRHEEACKKLGIRQTVNFATLHSICRRLLEKHCRLLGFENLSRTGTLSNERLSNLIADRAQELGINVPIYKHGKVIKAVNFLNSALVFDQSHVETRKSFIDTGMDYDEFQEIRRSIYNINKALGIVRVEDITLYTLQLLLEHPEISEELKRQNKVMLIDEFQDMSLLQLQLVSLMCDNVIAIGDIRQQIYAFNGACQEIVQKYKEYYPNHREANLTQSFRCANSIADFATGLVLANNTGGEEFKGTGEDGEVMIVKDFDFNELCSQLAEDYSMNKNRFNQSIMFLFRNNYSIVPVAEQLYQERLPFIVRKFAMANEMPVIRDLCRIVEVARNPSERNNVGALALINPELKRYRTVEEMPIYKAMRKSGKSIFEIKCRYDNPALAEDMLTMLIKVREAYLAGRPTRELFNLIWPMYKAFTLKDKQFYLDQEPEYYISMVSSLVTKTYDAFIRDERNKKEFIEDNIARNTGIRCYTLHGSKGTEADIVYILDAEDAIIPNQKKIQELIDNGCTMEAARDIRNERSLAYVGCTRARHKLVICYNDQLSRLFSPVNSYKNLDDLYKNYKMDYDDVEVFKEFVRGNE